MKFFGSLLNNLGFIFLLICVVLIGAQAIITETNASSVVFLGWEIGITDFRNFFAPVFESENALIQTFADNLIPCAIGGLAVTLLGGGIRKAAKKQAAK